MSDLPIIFSAPMIRALFDGRKSMTRRLAFRFSKDGLSKYATRWQAVKPGDRLWVRESLSAAQGWFLGIKQNIMQVHYAADDEECLDPHGFNLVWTWKSKTLPSIHMPRIASRLTLVVTATKIERVQEISNADCIAEGAEVDMIGPLGQPMVRIDGKSYHHQTVTLWFHRLWEELHGPDSWDANPECVCLSFTVHKTNIDALEDAA